MKKLSALLILMITLACSSVGNDFSSSDILVHRDVIELKTTKGWQYHSIGEVLNTKNLSEVHLFYESVTTNDDKGRIKSELQDLLDGKVKLKLISFLPVAQNAISWQAFIVHNDGSGFLLRKTWYDCFIVSHGQQQGVYQIQQITKQSIGRGPAPGAASQR
ncbi:MAG: hypothetical protein GWN00_36740 [Aliifodinibius sp.]|nr:hypothetical protein [Fodinibius sp.]NIV13015.1 hypothetical protein [Fodinibius sp.]NIY30133.1 hypothetical protein [Fodinibius sp.]